MLAVTTVGEGRSGPEHIPTDLGSLTGRLIQGNVPGPDQGVHEQVRMTTPLPPNNQDRSCATGESDQFRPIPGGAAQSDHGWSLHGSRGGPAQRRLCSVLRQEGDTGTCLKE